MSKKMRREHDYSSSSSTSSSSTNSAQLRSDLKQLRKRLRFLEGQSSRLPVEREELVIPEFDPKNDEMSVEMSIEWTK